MATNLPPQQVSDSAQATKLFFETYGRNPLQFPATEVTACVNFFTKRGFDDQASVVTATTLLKQSKIEQVSIFEVLDNLAGYSDLEISSLIAKVLNSDRVPTSTLGYKIQTKQADKTRNVAP